MGNFNLRNKLVATGAAGALLASMFFTHTTVATASSSSHQTDVQYSEEEIIRGVSFGEGPVAEQLGIDVPFDPEAPQEAIEEVQMVRDVLITEITSHEDEVANVVNNMTSGDPYRVEDGHRQLAGLMIEALEVHYPEAAKEAAVQPMCGVFVVCGAVSLVAVVAGGAIAVTTAAAVQAATAIHIETQFWGQDSRIENSADFNAFSDEDTADLDSNLYISKVATVLADG